MKIMQQNYSGLLSIQFMFTIIKKSVNNTNITTTVNKLQLSNHYTHWIDTLTTIYKNDNIHKISLNPRDQKLFLSNISDTIFNKRSYPIEYNTQINILQSIFPYPKYSRNEVLNILKNKNLLPNEIFFNSPDIDKTVNINFFSEAYLISNIDLSNPKIYNRQMFNENEKIDPTLSMQHCNQEHCDGKFLLSFENEPYQRMVDVKLGRVTVDAGSRIFPVILDLENNQFTGIRNEPFSLKDYFNIKAQKIVKILRQHESDKTNDIYKHLKNFQELLHENNLDVHSKLVLIQEAQHKISCLFENLKPRYNPEFLHVSKGTYIEQPFPTIKEKVSLHTLVKQEHPEIYKNIGACKDTLWAWDITFLDKIEFDCLL